MRLLPWSTDKKVSKPTPTKVHKLQEISYTTISGKVVRIQSSDVRNAPRYATKFGRVTGEVKI